MAKKLTRKTLEELAKEMVVLTKEEQKQIVGGGEGVIVVDTNGFLVTDNGVLANMPNYETMQNDPTTTYWAVYDPSGHKKSPFSTPLATPGSVSSSATSRSDSSTKITQIVGDAVSRDVLPYLAERTDVEWSMLLDTTGNKSGWLYTSGNSTTVTRPTIEEAKGYNEHYHSHPHLKGDEQAGPYPSKNDVNIANDLGENAGVTKSGFYDAERNRFVIFHGKPSKNKEDNEVTPKGNDTNTKFSRNTDW